MKGVFLLVCLVLIQLSCTEADQQNYGSEVSEVLDRNIREAKKDVKKKSKTKGKKTIKNKGRKNSRKSKSSKGSNNSKTKKNSKGRKNSRGKKNIKNKGSKISKRRKNSNGRNNSRTRKNSKGRKKSGGKKNIKNKERKNRKNKGRRVNNAKNNKGKGKKNSNSKGRKNRKSKGKNNSKTNIKKMKGKENRKKEARLTDKECYDRLLARTKNFKKYETQSRKAKRIKNFVSKINSKSEKAPTTFQKASANIIDATQNGTQCAGGNITDEVKTANEALQKCNETAANLCDSSTIDGLDMTLVEDCIAKLTAYSSKFSECLTSNDSCNCFDGLVTVEPSCTDFNDLETRTKTAKNNCNKNDKLGSFGYCRLQQRVVADVQCKYCPPTQTTTKAPGRRHQFSANRILQRLRKDVETDNIMN